MESLVYTGPVPDCKLDNGKLVDTLSQLTVRHDVTSYPPFTNNSRVTESAFSLTLLAVALHLSQNTLSRGNVDSHTVASAITYTVACRVAYTIAFACLILHFFAPLQPLPRRGCP